MERQEQYLRSALESRGELLLLWSAEGRVAFASRRFLDELGLTRELVEGADEAGLNRVLESLGMNSLPPSGMPASLATMGREFERHAFPLPQGARLDAFREVTHQRQEAKRREQLLGVATHDLRSPLANVRSYAGLLLGARTGGELDPKVKRSAEVIARNADRALKLLQSYFDSLRAETGELDIDRQPIELGPLVQEVIAARKGTAQEKAIQLDSRLPASLPKVLGDKDRLASALGAFLDNSLARAKPGSPVEVAAEVGPNSVEVKFADHGDSLSADQAREVFDRDVQILKERRLGVGFALAVAASILRAHGGSAAVSSLKEQTEFRVILPT